VDQKDKDGNDVVEELEGSEDDDDEEYDDGEDE
jgi:hypothetical protein